MNNATSHIIIGDVHGCYKTLMALLAKLPHSNVKLVGDLCDRGPSSFQVYQWAIDNNIPCVMGNHEHMLIQAYVTHLISELDPHDKKKKEIAKSCQSFWLNNGGDMCLKSYDPDETKYWHEVIPYSHLQWIGSLPAYLLYPFDNLIISHTGHGYDLNDWETALWSRSSKFPKDKYYRIFGHSITKDPVFTNTYSNIDTGAYLDKGKLTAIEYPSMRTWFQDKID